MTTFTKSKGQLLKALNVSAAGGYTIDWPHSLAINLYKAYIWGLISSYYSCSFHVSSSSSADRAGQFWS